MSYAALCPPSQTLPGSTASAAQLWAYNRALLAQGLEVLDKLQADAHGDFRYTQAVGPHLRHIIEHYQALLSTLANHGVNANSECVDYDARSRALDVQSDPAVTRQSLLSLMDAMAVHARNLDLSLAMPLTTRLQAGTTGELAVVVPTTLGRELLFVGSHTTHHFALLAHYCQAAGVSLGANFGKAPATVAFERKNAATA